MATLVTGLATLVTDFFLDFAVDLVFFAADFLGAAFVAGFVALSATLLDLTKDQEDIHKQLALYLIQGQN